LAIEDRIHFSLCNACGLRKERGLEFDAGVYEFRRIVEVFGRIWLTLHIERANPATILFFCAYSLLRFKCAGSMPTAVASCPAMG
jgi:hypothetical protein